MKAILLGAGRGRRLEPLTDERPKCMVEIDGIALLHWQLDALRRAGVEDVAVVRGWCRSGILGPTLRTIDNPRWDKTDTAASLACAVEELQGEVLVISSALLCTPEVVQSARQSHADLGVVVDAQWSRRNRRRGESSARWIETLGFDDTGRLVHDGDAPAGSKASLATDVGMVRLSAYGSDTVREALETARREGSFADGFPPLEESTITQLLLALISRGQTVMSIPVRGGWTRIEDHDDLEAAHRLVATDSWPRPHVAATKGLA